MKMNDNWPVHDLSLSAIRDQIKTFSPRSDRANYISYLLHRYVKVRGKWEAILAASPEGLDRSQVDRYAAILECEADFDTIVRRSYSIVTLWPVQGVPSLESYLDLEAIFHYEVPDNLYAKVDWNRLSKWRFFDFRLVKEYCDEIKEKQDKIRFLEAVKKQMIDEITAGCLVLWDADTKSPVYPDDKGYEGTMLEKVWETIDEEIRRIQLRIHRDSFETDTVQRSSFHDSGAIAWRGHVRILASFLELLLSNNLIVAQYEDLPGIAYGHFVDKYGRLFSRDEVSDAFDPSVPPLTEPHDEPICWKGTLPQANYLFSSLATNKLVWYDEDKYADVLATHFLNSKGQPIDPATVQKVNTRKRMDVNNPPIRKVQDLLDEVLGPT